MGVLVGFGVGSEGVGEGVGVFVGFGVGFGGVVLGVCEKVIGNMTQVNNNSANAVTIFFY